MKGKGKDKEKEKEKEQEKERKVKENSKARKVNVRKARSSIVTDRNKRIQKPNTQTMQDRQARMIGIIKDGTMDLHGQMEQKDMQKSNGILAEQRASQKQS